LKSKLKFLVVALYVLLSVTLVLSIHTKDVVPIGNATYDLGNSTDMYRDLWISRNAYIGGSLEVIGTSEFYDDMDLFGNFNASENITVGEDLLVNSSIRHLNSNSNLYYDENGTLVFYIGD